MMHALVDDKGALDIYDLCMVYLSVDIYIQLPFSQPEYYEGHIDDEDDVNDEDIVNLEEEDMIAKLYEEVIIEDSELKDAEVNVYIGEDPHVNVNAGDVNVGEGQQVNMNAGEVEVQHGNVNAGDVNVSEVHNENASYDSSEDESFNYDSALEVAFDDESDENDDFVEEEVGISLTMTMIKMEQEKKVGRIQMSI